ncbi:MAG: metallophosphoesterase family protein [Bacillota bacterium]
MKILHCSDIHLGKRPFGSEKFSQNRYLDYFKSFDFIVNQAIKKDVDVFLIAGDFFDKKELIPKTLEKAEKSLNKLKDRNIRVLIIEGNHDRSKSGDKMNSWISYLESKELLEKLEYKINIEDDKENYFFDKIKIKGINFYGLGYPGHQVEKIMKSLAQKIDKNERNIVMVHTAIADSSFLPGTINKETIDLFKQKSEYIAGGHFHQHFKYPKENPYFFLPGSSEYWNILKEYNQNKGFIIYDTENLDYHFHETSKREIIPLKYEINCNNEGELIEFLNERVSEKIDFKQKVVIVELKVFTDLFIDINMVKSIYESKNPLEVFVKIKYINSYEESTERNLSYLEIEKRIINEWDKFRKDSDKVVKSLQKLKTYQSENEAELFKDNFDYMLEYLLGEKDEN